jgi:hypothetical protein
MAGGWSGGGTDGRLCMRTCTHLQRVLPVEGSLLLLLVDVDIDLTGAGGQHTNCLRGHDKTHANR